MHSDSNDPTISFACPGCGALLEAPATAAGQVMQCPACQTAMEVPAPNPAPVTASKSSVGKRTVIKRGTSPQTRPGNRTAPTTSRSTPRNRRSPGAPPTVYKAKPKKSPMGKIVMVLFLLISFGGAGWYALTQGNGPAATGGGAFLARAAGGEHSMRTNAPLGPQSIPPNATGWQLNNRANISAFQWGGPGQEEIFDMVARQNGNMILSGMLPSMDSIPTAARQQHRLLDDRGTQNFGFLAEISADGTELLWISTFGGDLIRPEVLALSPDGSIAVGGHALNRARNHPGIQGDFDGSSSILGRISADGSEVLWMREGGPNQNTVRGLAVDQDGRVYFTSGGRERGMRAYVIRLNPDGSPSSFAKSALGGNEFWAINFDVRTPEFKVPGQIGDFYAKGVGQPYAYDGPQGWGAVQWWLHGIREGGHIAFLPNGDFVVTGSLQYDFVKGRDRRFPAFDLIMARYNQDGELLWSTNLYQEGDSVHTPDQIDQHLIYNPANGDLYVAAIQHGSNHYRLKGELLGATGNLMIGWIGQVDPENGTLKNGWYWQSNRNGQYTPQGSPQSPPHPQLSGNRPLRLTSDSEGRIYMTGTGSARMFTTDHAWKSWPDSQVGGTSPGIVILSPNLDRYVYASTLRGDDERSGTTNADARAVIVNEHGVWVAGENGTRNFPAGPQPPWANPTPAGERDNFLVNFQF